MEKEPLDSQSVSIRPGVSILSVLKHIEYDPWFALAEFVDNAVQSYLQNEALIRKHSGANHRLEVRIELNEADKRISIFDNAGGIAESDYSRAFRAAEIPPDNSGLSEFGMGMKSAACWFSDFWRVRTTAIGEPVERTVTFDLAKIFYDKLEELEVICKPKPEHTHYTVIELNNINRMPVKKTKAKIKQHLASIYRQFIRSGYLVLKVDNEILNYSDPAILSAPYPYNSQSPSILWRRDVELEVEPGRVYVKGFVALREKMSNSETGFALFRRGRVIEGSVDEGFRPKLIMGDPGSPEHKRIFGELHLEGFDVSFTKRGIIWDDNLDIFLQLLKDDLSHPDFPLLKQARDYRSKPSRDEIQKLADTVVRGAVQDFEKSVETIDEIRSDVSIDSDFANLSPTVPISFREFELQFNEVTWVVCIELSYDRALTDWLEIGDHLLPEVDSDRRKRRVGLRMLLSHPFVEKFAGTDKSRLEPILRLAASMGLAEVAARESGLPKAGVIRVNLNKILNSLSEKE